MAGTTNASTLLQFLRQHAVDRKLLDRVWETVELFIAIGDAKRYPLVKATEVDKTSVIEAIQKGLLTVATDVRCVSSSQGFPNDEWLQSDAYCNHPALSLATNRRKDLDTLIDDEVAEEFVPLFWLELGNRILFSFVKSHGTLVADMDQNMGGLLASTATVALFYLILYGISGQEEQIEEMETLLTLLTEAIPIGETWDELGTWLLLVR